MYILGEKYTLYLEKVVIIDIIVTNIFIIVIKTLKALSKILLGEK